MSDLATEYFYRFGILFFSTLHVVLENWVILLVLLAVYLTVRWLWRRNTKADHC